MSSVVAVRTAQLDVRDVAEPQAVDVDHEIANLLDGLKLAARPHAEALIAIGDTSGTDGKVAAFEYFANLVDVDAMRSEKIRLQQNANFAGINAIQVDQRNSFESLQPAL